MMTSILCYSGGVSSGSLDTIEGTPPEEVDQTDLENDNLEQFLELREIQLSEVRKHCTLSDAWMVVYDKVYDVTQFLMEVKKQKG